MEKEQAENPQQQQQQLWPGFCPKTLPAAVAGVQATAAQGDVFLKVIYRVRLSGGERGATPRFEAAQGG
jgi:hypothetical protein